MVPTADAPAKEVAVPDMLSYGASALVKSVSQGLKEDLLTVYNPSYVFSMMSLATLKVIRSAIAANWMKTHCLKAFVCRDYPGAVLSENSAGNLLRKIWMN